MFLLILHIMLIILCAANAIINDDKLLKILWSFSALCWLLVSVMKIAAMW
nr:MAG TPA: hypothetical protein [Caudoviricetes sp.]